MNYDGYIDEDGSRRFNLAVDAADMKLLTRQHRLAIDRATTVAELCLALSVAAMYLQTERSKFEVALREATAAKTPS